MSAVHDPNLCRQSTTSTNQVGLSLFWDLDFWGKYRRATEAARTNLLASEWARREIIAQRIANLTSAYFQLRVLDLQLEISRQTLASRLDSLQFTRLLAEGGATSMLDVRRAEQLVFTAGAEIRARATIRKLPAIRA
jgi:outer membrane protein, multidrug efflux system